jgi:hypothetical protein
MTTLVENFLNWPGKNTKQIQKPGYQKNTPD